MVMQSKDFDEGTRAKMWNIMLNIGIGKAMGRKMGTQERFKKV